MECRHGIRTLVHDNILSYDGFSNPLMEIFERKDPELPFKELAQLRQVGTLEAYILEFENISVMVSDVPIDRLDLLFTKGLIETLIGIMKSHKPATLKDSMNLTRDSQNVFLITKYIPQVKFPFQF